MVVEIAGTIVAALFLAYFCASVASCLDKY